MIEVLNKDPLYFKNVAYKHVYPISHLFSTLKNNSIFCFEIKMKKFFKCNYNNEFIDYLNPKIQITIEYLNSDIIISTIPTLSKNTKNIHMFRFIFIFDIREENGDVYEEYNNLKFSLDSIKNISMPYSNH